LHCLELRQALLKRWGNNNTQESSKRLRTTPPPLKTTRVLSNVQRDDVEFIPKKGGKIEAAECARSNTLNHLCV